MVQEMFLLEHFSNYIYIMVNVMLIQNLGLTPLTSINLQRLTVLINVDQILIIHQNIVSTWLYIILLEDGHNGLKSQDLLIDLKRHFVQGSQKLNFL